MGTTFSNHSVQKVNFNILVKDKITLYKFELIETSNLLESYIQSLKMTAERHSDKETLEIINTNMKLSELKLLMIDRVVVQLDNILFQIAVGIDQENLVDLLISAEEVVINSSKTVYVKKLEDMCNEFRLLINDDRKT